MIAINAPEDQRATGPAKQDLEPRASGHSLRTRHAVGVGTLGTNGFRAFVERELLRGHAGSCFAQGIEQEFEQRHADRDSVRGLFEVNSPAILVHLLGEFIDAR